MRRPLDLKDVDKDSVGSHRDESGQSATPRRPRDIEIRQARPTTPPCMQRALGDGLRMMTATRAFPGMSAGHPHGGLVPLLEGKLKLGVEAKCGIGASQKNALGRALIAVASFYDDSTWLTDKRSFSHS